MTAAGCTSPGTGNAAATPEQYLGEVKERPEMIDAVWFSGSVIDSLPNARYLLDDGSVVTESNSVVIGTITSVDDVRGYTLDGENVREVREGDTAMWHLVRTVVTVEEGWGADEGKSEVRVTFPLSSANSLQSSIDSLQALGRVLLILQDHRIVHSEEYLGIVDETGAISYPFIADPAVTEGVTTVTGLRTALAKTREPIPADLLGLHG